MSLSLIDLQGNETQCLLYIYHTYRHLWPTGYCLEGQVRVYWWNTIILHISCMPWILYSLFSNSAMKWLVLEWFVSRWYKWQWKHKDPCLHIKMGNAISATYGQIHCARCKDPVTFQLISIPCSFCCGMLVCLGTFGETFLRINFGITRVVFRSLCEVVCNRQILQIPGSIS